MKLASIIQSYRGKLEQWQGDRLLPSHRRALDAISRCRTSEAGEVLVRCEACGAMEWHPCSCGHRSCPRCQNHEASQWLDRQREKLLPVDYFLVTFTLPAQLRSLAWRYQRVVYDALFRAATETLKQFGRNPKHLGAEIGMTALLHTHSRRLTYHPHLHIVVPGGGIDPKERAWKKSRYRYLFNEFALAKLFRGKFLAELAKKGLSAPANTPKEWVVDCRLAGGGEPALEYLSRYLYRGVITESNILCDRSGEVTFCYTDGESGERRTETHPGEVFLWRVIQHVLPKGYQRVRNYGFLHHNARKQLQLLQLILQVMVAPKKRARPSYSCRKCGKEMKVVAIRTHQQQRLQALIQRLHSGPGPPLRHGIASPEKTPSCKQITE